MNLLSIIGWIIIALGLMMFISGLVLAIKDRPRKKQVQEGLNNHRFIGTYHTGIVLFSIGLVPIIIGIVCTTK